MRKDILILGAGRVGLQCTQILLEQGHNVTVLESDEERIKKLKDTTTATVIQGDASDTQSLEQANLSRIDEVLALTGIVQTNLVACLIIQKKGYEAGTTLRVASEEQKETYSEFVDNVVYPELSAATDIVKYIDREFSVVSNFGDQFSVCEVIVDKNAPVANKKLKDVNLPGKSLVIADDNTICSGDTTLKPETQYLAICEPENLEDFKILFNG